MAALPLLKAAWEFATTLRRSDGTAARLSVSGYQVCLRDANGEQWFFRKVPLDLWSD